MKKLVLFVGALIVSVWLLSFVLTILPAGWMALPTALTFLPFNFYLGYKIGGQLAHLQNEAEVR